MAAEPVDEATMHLCCTSLIVLLAMSGCRSTSSSAPERSAELLSVQAPARVVPGNPFTVVAIFGRGACDSARPIVEAGTRELRLGLRLAALPLPEGTACISLLVPDTVRAEVKQPYVLPYLVRLERRGARDTLLVITRN